MDSNQGCTLNTGCCSQRLRNLKANSHLIRGITPSVALSWPKQTLRHLQKNWWSETRHLSNLYLLHSLDRKRWRLGTVTTIWWNSSLVQGCSWIITKNKFLVMELGLQRLIFLSAAFKCQYTLCNVRTPSLKHQRAENTQANLTTLFLKWAASQPPN